MHTAPSKTRVQTLECKYITLDNRDEFMLKHALLFICRKVCCGTITSHIIDTQQSYQLASLQMLDN